METVRQPRCAVHVEIPPDRICTVFLQRVKRIHRIPLGLAHLLPLLILHVAQHDNILIRRLVEDQRRDRKQGVEPSAGLVHRLGDKICRELLLE